MRTESSREWDWPPEPPRRLRRPRPIYVDHERPRRTFWQTRAAQVFADIVFRLGIFAWKMILVCVLVVMMGFAVIVLVGLARATFG